MLSICQNVNKYRLKRTGLNTYRATYQIILPVIPHSIMGTAGSNVSFTKIKTDIF